MLFRFFLLYLLATFTAQAAPVPFRFAGRSVGPGQQMSVLPVVAGADTATIPVTVFHGQRPGPVLSIIAGVHGYEYAPSVATQQLVRTLDPIQLSGTVLLVHIANVPGFQGRCLEVGPQVGKTSVAYFPAGPMAASPSGWPGG